MSRGIDRTDDRSQSAAVAGGPDRRPHTSVAAARPQRPARPPGHRRVDRGGPDRLVPLPSTARRQPVTHAGRHYRLRATESQTLEVLATFRVALDRDLVQDIYAGRRGAFARDLQSLSTQGLVEHRALAADRPGPFGDGADTDTGRAGRCCGTAPGRRASPPIRIARFTPGWGKPRELAHDASLYRMYLQAEPEIRRAGGTVHRVILDMEWKHRLYRVSNDDPSLSPEARQARLLELARAEELPVVDGHVQLPDVRIEYDTPAGDRTRVDLELATNHYHAGHLSAKQQAGFTVFSAGGSAARGVASLGGGRGGSGYDPRYLSGLLSL